MNRELQILNQLGLVPADSVTIPKSSFGIVQHHALYLGYDEYNYHYMCENLIGVGVKLTRVEDFFKGVKHVTSIKKFTGDNFQRKQVVQRALTKLGQPYHFINYNCEHFVNDVLQNNSTKNQVTTAFKVASGVALFFLVVTLINEM